MNNIEETVSERAPQFRWGREGPVLLFALLFPTLGTWLYFVEFAGRAETMRWLYGSCKVIEVAVPIGWVVLVQRTRPRFGLASRKRALLGVAIGALITGAMLVLYYGFLKNSSLLRNTPQQVWQKIADVGITTP